MAISIQTLIEGQPDLIKTELGASLQAVMAVMLERGFSQIPIVENEKPIGMVTSDSIGQALLHMKTKLEDLKVIDAKVPFKSVSCDDELFSVLDDILRNDTVLVVNADGELQGIITAYDTTQYLRRRSEDIILVEDIETTLKDYLRYACNSSNDEDSALMKQMVAKVGPKNSGKIELLREKCKELKNGDQCLLNDEQIEVLVEGVYPIAPNAKPVAFEDLTLHQYITMAGKAEVWPQLEVIFGIKKDTFVRLLDPVRATRNELAHFRGDIAPLDRNRLRYCADWFKSHPVPVASVQSPTSSSSLSGGVGTTELNPTPTFTEDSETDECDLEIPEGKYAPLARYLKGQPPEVSELTITFEQIEEKIKVPLPDTAREHRSWWANDSVSHIQSRQWLASNWRVSNVNMRDGKVVFQRMEQEEKAAQALFSDVRAVLESKGSFILSPNVQRDPLQNALVRFKLGHTGWAELSIRYINERSISLKWYVNARNQEINDSLRSAITNSQFASEELLKQKMRVERLAAPPLQRNKEDVRAFRVVTEYPLSLKDMSKDAADQLAEFVVRFYDIVAPLIEQATLPLSGTS